MAITIKLKNASGSDPSASDLVVGEVAIRTDNGKLFTKKDDGSVAEISGSGGSGSASYYINTLSSSSGTGGGSASFNGSAYRFTLSDAPSTAPQLLVSIDGVIQKPNTGTSQPSEGFAIDGDDIIFAAAPASGASFFIVSTVLSASLVTPADDTVTSAKIVDGSIVNADINASAAIAGTKIADASINASDKLENSSITENKLGSGVVSSAKIADGTIVNADINASAAIAGTKISPDFGSQAIATTGNLTSNNITISGSGPRLTFTDSNENPDFYIEVNATQFLIQDATNNAQRLRIQSNGVVDIDGNTNFGAGIDVVGNITATGTVDGVDIATRDTLFGGLTSSSGVLSNGVTATTQSAGDNSTKIATTAYTDTAISNLVDSSPSALNTLNELAAALGDDANFSTTVTNSIATKMPLAGGEFTGNVISHNITPDTDSSRYLGSNGTRFSKVFADVYEGSGANLTNLPSQTDQNFTTTLKNKLDGIATGATNVTNTNQLTNGAGFLTSVGTSDISNNAVTFAKIEDIAQNRIIGRVASGSGDATTLTAANVRTMINVEDGATNVTNNNQLTNGAGYITSADGGNAATLDGIDSTSFVRSDASDSLSGQYNFTSTSNNDLINFTGNSTSDNRGIAFNSRTALSADYNDGYLRLNNASEFSSGVYTPLVMRADGGFNVDGNMCINGYGNYVKALSTASDYSSLLRSDTADTASGDITFSGGAGAATIAAGSDIRFTNGDWTGNYTKIQHHVNYLYVQGGSNGIIFRHSNGTNRWIIDSSGHLVTSGDSNYDIGSNSVRVRNGYFDTLYGDGSNLTNLPSQTDNNFTTTLKNKLDGIEANATADQTASEILTLIKTVDGSGSGLDADTLDGISSGSFLRSDQADTFTGNLTVNGIIYLQDQIRIGDDAFIEDFNIANCIRVKGNQDNNKGFIAFGSQSKKLGCDGASADLTYDGNTVWHAGNSTVGGFPAGTKMFFQQSSAPTGWTKDTSNNNNSALRVVTGNVSSGGSNNFTTAFNSSRGTSGGSVSNHTLTEAQIPSHRHRVDTYNEWSTSYGHYTSQGGYRQAHAGGTRYPPWTQSIGSGNAHNHGFSNPSINLNVKYVDVILCSKN